MIKKVKKIKNLGIFSDYTWDNNLAEFRRYNLFYGWNGSGKTTLSKLFSYLETGSSSTYPDLEYEIESEDGNFKHGNPFNKKIRIFNHDYINNNVQLLSGRANPIFILGEENKEIAEQIETDEKALEELENLKQTKEEEKTRKETEKGKAFTNVASIIGANLVGSSTRNYRKPDAEKDFLALTTPKILNEDELAHQRDVIKQEQKEKIALIEPSIEFDLTNLYTNISAICSETVEVNVVAELAENPELSKWVEEGLKFHDSDEQKCKFCDSSIPENRLSVLLGHFNEADKKLKEKIESKVSDLQNMIRVVQNTRLPNKAQFYSDLQTSFTSKAVSFSQEKDNFCSEISAMVEILESKKQKTTEVVSFARSLTNSFEQVVNSVNEVIEKHNQKTDNFQTKKDEAVEVTKQHHLSEIHEEVKSLEVEIKECSEEITKLVNGDESDPELMGINALRLRIAESKNKISSEHKACDSLNKQLSTFLGRDEITFEVAPESGYHIKRNNIIAKNLSEGEKTAIAFVYFVVQLDDQDFDINEGIVVIDDPVSSLDSNSLFQAFAFLKNAVKDAKQVFLFTHNFAFLKLLLNWLNNFPEARDRNGGKRYLMINNHVEDNERHAFIAKLDPLLEKHDTEYQYLFKRLYTFQSDGTLESVYDIPNVARKVLDTFLMFRVPSRERMYNKLEKLDFDEEKKAAIYKFVNDMSHVTGDGFDPSLISETQNNVKYLLELIENTFPEHYQILVEDSAGD